MNRPVVPAPESTGRATRTLVLAAARKLRDATIPFPSAEHLPWRSVPVVERLKTKVCQPFDEGENLMHSVRYPFVQMSR